jgi:hypothetical protein
MDSFRLQVEPERKVSAILLKPADPVACFAFAHGAGAGMSHPFMERMNAASPPARPRRPSSSASQSPCEISISGNRDIFQQKQGDYCGKTGNYDEGLGV